MGITPESYPFLEVPLPFFYHLYETWSLNYFAILPAL